MRVIVDGGRCLAASLLLALIGPITTATSAVETSGVETSGVETSGAANYDPRATGAAPSDAAVLVLIIDDLGNELEAGRRAASLPGKVNLAVLPHTPHAHAVAASGLASGKEILLHAPMSNTAAKPLGRGALTAAMSEREFRRTLATSIETTPGIRGINNHMGSLLTTRREQMGWVMEELASRGLYFVDSRTSPDTVAASVAGEFGIPHLSRHVFLDNEREGAAVHHQFEKALQLARRRGVAIAIGHPHDVTLDYLHEQLPGLEKQGYRLALISEIVSPATRPTPNVVRAPRAAVASGAMGGTD